VAAVAAVVAVVVVLVVVLVERGLLSSTALPRW